jgi:hypothetical protein
MTKHLADRRMASKGGRVKAFLRIAGTRGDALWRGLWQRPVGTPANNRRVVEFARIARGRSV